MPRYIYAFALLLLVGLIAGGCGTRGAEDGASESTADSEVDGAALGKEVCACTEKANAMDGSDPDRPAAHIRCRELQASTWATVRGTPQQAPYNAQFPCGL